MKKICFVLLVALFALKEGSAQKLTAFFSYCVFNQPNGDPYVETYLTVLGNTVRFVPGDNGKHQSKIEIQWLLKNAVADTSAKQDNGLVFFDKYNLLSPEINSDSAERPNFLDQKRIPARNGDFILQLTILDKYSNGSKYTVNEPVSIHFPDDKLSFSDIELLESFSNSTSPNPLSKSGYDLTPNPSNFFPKDVHSIKFYVELYNGKKILGDDYFVFRYQIVNEGNKQIVNDLAGYKKMKAEPVNAIVMDIPIDRLSSGNYSLVVEARDNMNEVRSLKTCYFQRSNPKNARKESETVAGDFALADVNNTFISSVTNKDTLKDYIACLYPISNHFERQVEENQLRDGTVESMQKFIYYFWSTQDSLNPEFRWQEYQAEVAKVNYSYSCFNKKGYDSDQGRVYLQYGPPNSIEMGDNSPSSYPYEIWHYYSLGEQTNRKFVFYSKFRAVSCYSLLSSDARGETYLYDWNYRLHPSQQIGTYGIDADDTHKNPYNSFGDRTRDSYDHPH